MSHAIRHLDYHCSTSEKAILKDLNSFAYDPQETSGYHGNLKFHKEPVYKTRDDAMAPSKRWMRAGMTTTRLDTARDAKSFG